MPADLVLFGGFKCRHPIIPPPLPPIRHGSAAGAGLSLAFVADLCIATEDARFTPAYAKLGVSPDGGGTVGVVASVGARRALQIFLAEDSFSAKQAYDWGLVAKIVPAAELKAATRDLAHRLAQH